MAGRIYLHPMLQAGWGMGWISLRQAEPAKEEVAYLVPGSRMVKELKRQLLRYSPEVENVSFLTFNDFVRQRQPRRQVRQMDAMEKELLVQQAIARVQEGFTYFKNISAQRNWQKRVEEWIGQMKRAGILPDRLASLWSNRGEKYMELARIYTAYQELLYEYGLSDHMEPYYLFMNGIRQKEVSLPGRVVAEHFYDLFPLQEQLLIQLVTADLPVDLHLGWDASRPRLFEQTIRTINRLRNRGFAIHLVEGEHQKSWKRTPLAHLTVSAFSSEPKEISANRRVEWIHAPGIEREVEQVVARVKGWLAETDGALSDVALIVPNVNRYHPLLLRMLNQAGLPCARGEQRPLGDHPLMQTLFRALRVPLDYEMNLLPLLQSPYMPWGDEEERSRWIKWYQRLGRPRSEEEWMIRSEGLRSQLVASSPEEMAPPGELYRWLGEIPAVATWSDYFSWFSRWSLKLKRTDTWIEMMEDPVMMPMVVEEIHVWSKLQMIVDRWREFLQRGEESDGKCNLETFTATLRRLAESVTISGLPGRRAGIRLLEPDDVRGDRYRAVFLLGVAEGDWPPPIREDWLVPDRERLALRNEGVWLDTSKERSAYQLYPFYLCMSAAEELLVFSYPGVDEQGRKKLPSPYLDEVLRLFRDDSVGKTELDVSDLLPVSGADCVWPDRGLEWAIAMLSSKSLGEEETGNVHRAVSLLSQQREERPHDVERILARIRMERIRWGEHFSPYDGVLENVQLRRWITENLAQREWSVSQLNEMVRCRFHFFAGRLLHLTAPEEEAAGLSALERGQLLHRVLCRFWDGYRKEAIPSEEQAWEKLQAVTEAVFRQFVAEKGHKLQDPLALRLERAGLLRRLRSMLMHELYWRKRTESTLLPHYLELAFGMALDPALLAQGEMDPASDPAPAWLTLPSGRRIKLRGKIDRVDVDQEGYYVLYDYKLGSAPRAVEIYQGAQLQLPLYLWVLQQVFHFPPDKAIGAAFFIPSRFKEDRRSPTDNRNRGLWRREEAKRAGIAARSLLNEEEWRNVQERIGEQLEQTLADVEQGNFAVDPTWECPPYCSHRLICRIDGSRMAKKGRRNR